MTAPLAVVFDWGGTLTPWHDIDLSAQWYAYAEVYDPENARSLAQRLWHAEEARWRRQRDTAGGTSTGALDAVFLDEGIDITSARHLRALGQYLDFWAPHTLADPDALGLLGALREAGLRIGVLSNTMWPRTHHEEVFARDGLLELIDAALYTSEMPVAKPHADAFHAIAHALGVAPDECAFVGDRMWDDIAGARQVGMCPILIPHSTPPAHQVVDTEVEPDAVAHRLAEVYPIVMGWRSARP
jgi:putative hydrolase of the HAD superfamily